MHMILGFCYSDLHLNSAIKHSNIKGGRSHRMAQSKQEKAQVVETGLTVCHLFPEMHLEYSLYTLHTVCHREKSYSMLHLPVDSFKHECIMLRAFSSQRWPYSRTTFMLLSKTFVRLRFLYKFVEYKNLYSEIVIKTLVWEQWAFNKKKLLHWVQGNGSWNLTNSFNFMFQPGRH